LLTIINKYHYHSTFIAIYDLFLTTTSFVYHPFLSLTIDNQHLLITDLSYYPATIGSATHPINTTTCQ